MALGPWGEELADFPGRRCDLRDLDGLGCDGPCSCDRVLAAERETRPNSDDSRATLLLRFAGGGRGDKH